MGFRLLLCRLKVPNRTYGSMVSEALVSGWIVAFTIARGTEEGRSGEGVITCCSSTGPVYDGNLDGIEASGALQRLQRSIGKGQMLHRSINRLC